MRSSATSDSPGRGRSLPAGPPVGASSGSHRGSTRTPGASAASSSAARRAAAPDGHLQDRRARHDMDAGARQVPGEVGAIAEDDRVQSPGVQDRLEALAPAAHGADDTQPSAGEPAGAAEAAVAA